MARKANTTSYPPSFGALKTVRTTYPSSPFPTAWCTDGLRRLSELLHLQKPGEGHREGLGDLLEQGHVEPPDDGAAFEPGEGGLLDAHALGEGDLRPAALSPDFTNPQVYGCHGISS